MQNKDWMERIFLRPILQECPPHVDKASFLSSVFSIREREICVYRANRGYDIQGRFLEGGVHPVDGMKDGRKIKANQICVVRKDHKDAYYDLEFDGRVFRLTEYQWHLIRPNLRKAKGQDEIDGYRPRKQAKKRRKQG